MHNESSARPLLHCIDLYIYMLSRGGWTGEGTDATETSESNLSRIINSNYRCAFDCLHSLGYWFFVVLLSSWFFLLFYRTVLMAMDKMDLNTGLAKLFAGLTSARGRK